MARLITKFGYFKPGAKKKSGGYAKYIATREGVEKIDESKKNKPATVNQRRLIGNILRDYPDTRNMLEYEDYRKSMTAGNASDFISRAIEENSSDIVGREGYAKYIALRPRAERMGSHGLFTDEGVAVNLSAVTDEMNRHKGNIWTIIISLRREDAERLGFNTGDRWRTMLRTQTANLSECFKIPMTHLRWYAAFHQESTHPHVHMMVYSTVENEGYLSKIGVEKLRSAFANDIFMQDQYCTYEKQTEYRDRLRADGKKYIADIVEKINTEQAADPQIQALLLQLADKLSKTKGKKVYGYLKPEVKAIVDAIMIKLSENEQVAQLYDLWYQQKENAMKVYSDELPPRIPLVDNKEFKPLKNAIIQEALKISEQEYSDSEQKRDEEVSFPIAENEDEPVSISDDDTPTEEENEQDNDEPLQFSDDEIASEDDERPPEPLPNNDSINNRRNYYAAMGSLRLLRYLARMLQNRIDDQKIKADSRIDRKLYQKIQDKKHAQGLK